MTTNITEEHRRAFEALANGAHDNFAPFSCRCNDEAAAAIVVVNRWPPAEEGGERMRFRGQFDVTDSARRAAALMRSACARR